MDKDLLLKRTKKLFFKYGIRSVTMDDIARQLGISKKTIYEHITDKNDLIAQIAEIESKQITLRFNEIKKEGENAIDVLFLLTQFEGKLREMYPPALEYDLKKYYPDVYNHVTHQQKKEMYSFIQENLERGIAEEYYRNDLDVQIIAAFHVARMDIEIEEHFCSKLNITPQKIMHELLIYHLHAICSKKGLQYIAEKS
ncbi:MAG: hypothetical protein CSB06_00150 [Bacteroidia bacterium]|nr:MAG: hypothetical protein CSB06_00150 [Bacteroidia bacterium]